MECLQIYEVPSNCKQRYLQGIPNFIAVTYDPKGKKCLKNNNLKLKESYALGYDPLLTSLYLMILKENYNVLLRETINIVI